MEEITSYFYASGNCQVWGNTFKDLLVAGLGGSGTWYWIGRMTSNKLQNTSGRVVQVRYV
jgi:membrane protein DedA with SNARE-associated domain